MCFSVEADLAVGIGVGVVGIDALRHVTRPTQWPLASLPLLFAAHQFNEAFVWWGLDGALPRDVATIAAWVYLFIAFLLPVAVPVSTLLIEPDRTRRRVIWGIVALGAFVSAVLVTALIRGGAHAALRELHVAYAVEIPWGNGWVVLYVVATCGAFLASSDRRIAVVGVVNLIAVAVLGWFLLSGVISLWCAWAAVASVLIASYLRTTPGPPDSGERAVQPSGSSGFS